VTSFFKILSEDSLNRFFCVITNHIWSNLK
jgi:hypothetical protein